MYALGNLQPKKYYHIFVPPDDSGCNLFAHRDDYHIFLRDYCRLIVPVAETLAYCLLPTHFHLLIRVRTLREQIAYWYEQHDMKMFVPLKAADQFEKLTDASHLLKASSIPTQIDASHLLRYIHHRPIDYQIADFRCYSWSSYQVIMQSRPTFVSRQTVLRWFYGVEWYEEIHWETADLSRIGYLLC